MRGLGEAEVRRFGCGLRLRLNCAANEDVLHLLEDVLHLGSAKRSQNVSRMWADNPWITVDNLWIIRSLGNVLNLGSAMWADNLWIIRG